MQISLRKATATRSLRGSPRDKDHDDDDDDDVIPVFGQAKSRCLLFTSHGQLNAAGCSYLPWPLDPQSLLLPAAHVISPKKLTTLSRGRRLIKGVVSAAGQPSKRYLYLGIFWWSLNWAWMLGCLAAELLLLLLLLCVSYLRFVSYG